MDLLNKFWYSSLPPLGPRPRYPVEYIHADYAVLLGRLMKYVILPAVSRLIKHIYWGLLHCMLFPFFRFTFLFCGRRRRKGASLRPTYHTI